MMFKVGSKIFLGESTTLTLQLVSWRLSGQLVGSEFFYVPCINSVDLVPNDMSESKYCGLTHFICLYLWCLMLCAK